MIYDLMKEMKPEWQCSENIPRDINVKLTSCEGEEYCVIRVCIDNHGREVFTPESFSISLGLDLYMEKYPEWLNKYAPTMLCCEKTHFHGYFQTPNSKGLIVTCNKAIASWHSDYNTVKCEAGRAWTGHRIENVWLDLLHNGPLPETHPSPDNTILPGEVCEFIIKLHPVDGLEAYEELVSDYCDAPVFKLKRTTVSSGEALDINIISSEEFNLYVYDQFGQSTELKAESISQVQHIANYKTDVKGLYMLKAVSESGKESTAYITVRPKWLWFMEKAYESVLKYPPKATSHNESWYGFYTGFIGGRIFGESSYLKEIDHRFGEVYPLLFDNKGPIKIPYRIQNTGSMIGVLTDRYECYGNTSNLDRASNLADWLITHTQNADGAYMSGKTHYTSVVYTAKSIMELMLVEKQKSVESDVYRKRYERHYKSVKRAMDQLVESDGNIETEGELTFEDGMIACSALQLLCFSMITSENPNPYIDAGLKLLKQHDCLTQKKICDSRRRGGTLRFWESQYDVGIQPGFLNSPHGWSAWRIYATYYAYLITSDVEYLHETFNGLSSCCQLIDVHTGKLRWAFVSDPYVEVKKIVETIPSQEGYQEGQFHTDAYESESCIIGHEYIDMISDVQGANFQDNDVHEIFKCMDEIAIGKAYIYLEEDQIKSYNCSVIAQETSYKIRSSEGDISSIHFGEGITGTFEHEGELIECSKDSGNWYHIQ